MEPLADKLELTDWQTLGAHWDGRGTHFCVFAEGAERVDLCIFGDRGKQIARLPMPDCLHGVWRGYLPNARPGTQYGYRVYGPYEPHNGHRFNHHKLLLDPYARQIAGTITWHDALFGYRLGSSKKDLSFDRRDSAQYMPKAVVTDDYFDWGDDRRPHVPWEDTVIYELHVRGFTRLRNDLPEHDRGTFGALGHHTTIEYLKSLGVTTVELLPVHLFLRDRLLVERGLTNYWGYNTLSFFAPDTAYLSDRTLGQMKWAIKQLHAAGIEVILDVVYNHTCEGNELGPTLSWRGFGNASYYRLLPEERRYHINDTGCGNTLDMTHRRVIQMIMDSLRYWVREFRVDGFRFDLCATLGREPHGFDPNGGFFDAIMQDPLLAGVKLIAEPWDIGPGGHQVGNHPPGFAEWNDCFRDDIRRFWHPDGQHRSALAARLQGSAEIFDRGHRRPWAGVNFITAHDGFTLHDLVSHNSKHNEANGEDNRDGTDHNCSFNWGEEGDTEDVAIRQIRARIKRNMLATLLCSHGTPMLLAGDELGHSQQGNNNVYCQDNELSWLDWRLLDSPEAQSLRGFVARLIALRKSLPPLRSRWFQHANVEVVPGLADVAWFDKAGRPLQGDAWHQGDAYFLAMQRCAHAPNDSVDLMLWLANSNNEDVVFSIPFTGITYRIAIDTYEPERQDGEYQGEEVLLKAQSLIMLISRPTRHALEEAVAAYRVRSEEIAAAAAQSAPEAHELPDAQVSADAPQSDIPPSDTPHRDGNDDGE